MKDSDIKMGLDDASLCKVNANEGLLIRLRESASPSVKCLPSREVNQTMIKQRGQCEQR